MSRSRRPPHGPADADDPPGVAITRLGVKERHLMDAMLTLFAEVFGEPETYDAARPRRAYTERLLASEDFIALVAVEGGAVIGGLAAYVLRKFEQERSEIYIYDLAVAAEHRRRGVATALIGEVRRIARECRAHVVMIQADREDEPAIALYSRLGEREAVLHFDIAPE